MHLHSTQLPDTFISDVLNSVLNSDDIVAQRRLQAHIKRIIDGHENISGQALLLRTVIESSDESSRRNLEDLQGLEEVKRISENAEDNSSIAAAKGSRRRLVAFTSVMRLLGPAVLAHHGWVPPTEESGSGRKYFEALLTSVKKSNSNKATWTRRLNRAIYDRVWKDGERKLAAAIAPKQKTVGTPESLVQQCDLEQVKTWADNLDWPNNDQPLTSKEVEDTGCTLDDFGILTAKTERFGSPRPGPTPKQNRIVKAGSAKRSFVATNLSGADAGYDALSNKRHQAHVVSQNNSLRRSGRRPPPQLPTPERELAATSAQEESSDTASENQEEDEVSTQHSESDDSDVRSPSLSSMPADHVENEIRDRQDAETDEARLQQQRALPPLADAAALESEFERCKDNIQAHLTRLQSYLDSVHYRHIDVAKKWLTNAERPRYSPIDERFDPSATTDCDVYMVLAGESGEGQRRFLDLLEDEENPFILDRPVHIRGESFMRDTTAEQLASQLVKFCPKVESQGYGAKNEIVDAEVLLDMIQLENTPMGSDGEDRALRVPMNVLNLRTNEYFEQPKFLLARHGDHQRFGLLNDLVRYKTPQSQVPRGNLASDQQFQLLATTLAFSGAHVDILGGTWIRILDGEKLWLFASEERTTSKDLDLFENEANAWVPEKPCLVTLKKGDTFYMPAGTRIIHAPLTLRPCHIRGGMVWDYKSILPTLRNLAWTCKHSATVSNEDVPKQLPNAILALKAMAEIDGCKSYAEACGMELAKFRKEFYTAVKACQDALQGKS